jgi:hypothetical protein
LTGSELKGRKNAHSELQLKMNRLSINCGEKNRESRKNFLENIYVKNSIDFDGKENFDL